MVLSLKKKEDFFGAKSDHMRHRMWKPTFIQEADVINLSLFIFYTFFTL